MTAECCVSRIESKKGWQIYRQPKSFCDGIIKVKRALDDVDTGIKFNLTNNNCESYVNKWWNNRIISHQSKSTIKWGGLVFFGFILSTFSFLAKKGYDHKKEECDASNNITRILYVYAYKQLQTWN